MRRTVVSGSRADLLVPLAQRVDRDHPFPVCRRAWRERGLARRGRTRVTCRIREKKLRVSNPTRLLPTCVDAVPLRARCRGRQVVVCRSGAIGAPQGATSSEQRVVICQSSAKGAPRGASSSEQRVVICQSSAKGAPMTHADALRNLVVTAVFRVALHANVPGWSQAATRESRPHEG